ncbi:hypothetical protein BGZ94_005667 [Podila epigama]|nr:hypothetical protein BGZ94_005667 [Podila epigama]
MCMAVSDDGSKMVVFGGRRKKAPFDMWLLNDIYILDLKTNVWTKGRNYPKARLYSACTLINDLFISWGGSDESTTVSNTAIVYDIKRNKYLSQYLGSDPDSDYDPAVGPQKEDPGSGSGSGSDSGFGSSSRRLTQGEIGGIIAGVFVLLIIANIIHYMRRKGTLKKRQGAIVILEERHSQNAAATSNNSNNNHSNKGGQSTAHLLGNSNGAVTPVRPPTATAASISHTSVTPIPISSVTMVQPAGNGGYHQYQYTPQSAPLPPPSQVALPYPQLNQHRLNSPLQSHSLPYPPAPSSDAALEMSLQKQEDVPSTAPPEYLAHPATSRSRGPEYVPQ